MIICVMAKAPVPGQVKTRLCPPLDEEQAAHLARAFLRDTISTATALLDVEVILAVSGPRDYIPGALRWIEVVDQGGGDLGQRMSRQMEAMLARDERVLIIGSDLPGLPVSHLEDARAALEDHDVCVGPSADGGYYLIGAARWEPDLLDGLPWSADNTREATLARLGERGYRVATLEPFDDVDTPDDLDRLCAELEEDPSIAPATAALISML